MRPLLLAVTLTATAVITAAGPASADTPPYGTASDDSPAACASGTPDCPSADAFYTPPAELGALTDGSIVGTRTATIAQPGPLAGSAYTVSYRSEDSFGAPVLGVATVLLPATPYVGTGPTPLVSFQFAEDSLGRQCAPSYALGHEGANDIISAESADVESLLAQGYDVVIPDAEGPAEQFIAGQQEGHAVLDGVRAAEALPAAGLSSSTPVALMGYSGGAHATGWAAELAATYAPGLNIVGAVEGGTPADLSATAKYNDGGATFGLVLFAAIGLDRAFPGAGIHGDLNAAGLAAEESAGTQCVQGVVSFPQESLDSYTTTPDLIDTPTFQSLLSHELLGTRPPHFPIFNYHATTDEIVPYAQDKTLVDTYCKAGVAVDHVTFPADHLSGEVIGVPLALTWLAARFAGAPATNTCAVTNLTAGPTTPPATDPPATLPETPLVPALVVVGGLTGYAVLRRRRHSPGGSV